MKQKSPQLRIGGLSAVLATALLALCILALPAKALAAPVIARSIDSLGDVTNYHTFEEVEQKGPNVDVVVMDTDRHLDSAFTVNEKKKITIDMNGHKVDCNHTCFWVQDNAELVLKSSSDPVTFSYTGYNPQTDDAMDVKSTTGGLIVSLTKEAGGAFCIEKNGTLSLDNVTAGGSHGSEEAAGVVDLDPR